MTQILPFLNNKWAANLLVFGDSYVKRSHSYEIYLINIYFVMIVYWLRKDNYNRTS